MRFGSFRKIFPFFLEIKPWLYQTTNGGSVDGIKKSKKNATIVNDIDKELQTQSRVENAKILGKKPSSGNTNYNRIYYCGSIEVYIRHPSISKIGRGNNHGNIYSWLLRFADGPADPVASAAERFRRVFFKYRIPCALLKNCGIMVGWGGG